MPSSSTKSSPVPPKAFVRRQTSRRSRSVDSPAMSNNSARLSSIIKDYRDKNQGSFMLSPLVRRSILTDKSDIGEPTRKSWWKNLDENSRDVIEVLENNKVVEANNIMEELDLEILSQEKKTYNLDIPDSSDGESIHSIVLPQRKLFTDKVQQPQRKFGKLINNRDTLDKIHKNTTTADNAVNMGPKEIFQNKRSRPVFPAALLTASPNKTMADKTLTAVEPKAQVHNIFGNRQGKKRKNMFANFVLSESEDEISEIQAKVFDFHKQSDAKTPNLRNTSPTSSNTTDVELDDWIHLPSSTMVETQLEAMITGGQTPKKARLSKLSEAIESESGGSVQPTNKTKQSDKSFMNVSKAGANEHPRNKSAHNNKNKSLVLELKADNENVEQHTNKEPQESENQTRNQTKETKQKIKLNVVPDKPEIDNKTEDTQNKNDDIQKETSEADVSKLEEAGVELELNMKDKTQGRDIQNESLGILNVKRDENVQESQNEAADESQNESETKMSEDEHKDDENSYEMQEDEDDQVSENNEEHESNKENIQMEIGQDSQHVESDEDNQESEVENEKVEVDEENDQQRPSNDESDHHQDSEEKNQQIETNDENDHQNQTDQLLKSVAENEQHQESEEENEHVETDDENDQQRVSNDESDRQHESDEENEQHQESEDENKEVETDDENDQQRESHDESDRQHESVEENEQHQESDEENEQIDTDDENDPQSNDESDQQLESNEENELHQESVEDNDHHENVQQDEIDLENDNQQDNIDKSNTDIQDQDVDVINGTPNVSHDTTGRNRKKNQSPEMVLHDATNHMTDMPTLIEGRKTKARATKSMIKAMHKPSLEPERDSIGFGDGSKNSSAEGSGWDSHRTTRKTLRQTFGKDITPRKSLRALVMEKSAKRQTYRPNQSDSSVTSKFPLANSTAFPEVSAHVDECPEVVESDHEVSIRTRQTTLEMFLQKIQVQNREKRLKMEEAVKQSLKVPARNMDGPFKIPTRPVPRRPISKTTNTKPKAKKTKTLACLQYLPEEVIEDMKYKPPKRFQPRDAPWITKHLYKYFETKLVPKYHYKARVRAEKLVESIYNFTKNLRRQEVASMDAVDVLKHEMARLNIVTTHHEFYLFFHDFMPRDVRIKVVPDIVNKIPMPRDGVFAEIIKGTSFER